MIEKHLLVNHDHPIPTGKLEPQKSNSPFNHIIGVVDYIGVFRIQGGTNKYEN
jgi:hypothetical protein